MLETFSDHLSLTSYYPDVNLLCNVLSIPALQMKFDDLSLSRETSEDLSNGSVQLPTSLRRQIMEDPIFFVSLSMEQLQLVVDLETNNLEVQLGCSEYKADVYRESCQRELDKRIELKEAIELLQIFKKATEKSNSKEELLQSKIQINH